MRSMPAPQGFREFAGVAPRRSVKNVDLDSAASRIAKIWKSSRAARSREVMSRRINSGEQHDYCAAVLPHGGDGNIQVGGVYSPLELPLPGEDFVGDMMALHDEL